MMGRERFVKRPSREDDEAARQLAEEQGMTIGEFYWKMEQGEALGNDDADISEAEGK